MSEIRKYPLDFVKRTMKLYDTLYNEALDNDLEVTLLLNCLLGFIVAIKESDQNNKIPKFNKKIYKLKKEDTDAIPTDIKYREPNLNDNRDNVYKYDLIFDYGHLITQKNMYFLISEIRNSIAHQNIEIENKNGKVKNIIFYCYDKNKVIYFEVKFTIKKLKDFSLFLANNYVEKYTDS